MTHARAGGIFYFSYFRTNDLPFALQHDKQRSGETPMNERIVRLGDLFTTYAEVRFNSVIQANAWLTENGFENVSPCIWVRHGGGKLWFGFECKIVTVEGDMIAREYSPITVEELGFKAA
jgi:hypothetical protein